MKTQEELLNDKIFKDMRSQFENYSNELLGVTHAELNDETTLDHKNLLETIKMLQKPKITEICVTDKIKNNQAYVFFEKYLCMNYETYKKIENEIVHTISGIPIYFMDERFLSYFNEALKPKPKRVII